MCKCKAEHYLLSDKTHVFPGVVGVFSSPHYETKVTSLPVYNADVVHGPVPICKTKC